MPDESVILINLLRVKVRGGAQVSLRHTSNEGEPQWLG
jgi:hypothetical protein